MRQLRVPLTIWWPIMRKRPALKMLLDVTGLSASHFQRVFKAGAGVSPKRFLQFLAANKAKKSDLSGG